MVDLVIRFYSLRVLKDIVGHVMLIGLPLLLITIMIALNEPHVPEEEFNNLVLFIGLAYTIMFQGFGAAYTSEGIENDFFKPFKSRLLVTPINPMRYVLMTLSTSIVLSFLQSTLLILYLMVVYRITINNVLGVLAALFLGVVLSQLLASLFIFLTKKAGTTQAIITVYLIAGMMVGGFFFSLPTSDLVVFLEKFSSPLAWVRYAAYGFIDGDVTRILVGMGLLSLGIVIVGLFSYRLSQKVLK